MARTRGKPSRPASPLATGASAPLGPKVDKIVKHCVFEISTGAWRAGEKLPSVRRAADDWSVNHLTVLKAYRRVVELGLARNVERSGFFVADTVRAEERGRNRVLDDIFEELAERLDGMHSVSTLAAFRHLATLAEARARRAPECAFVECTRFQADGHAQEIRDRLELPCRALSLDELSESSVDARTLITTGFHRAEASRRVAQAVAPHATRTAPIVTTVPIEFSPDLAARLEAVAREVLFLNTDEGVAAHVARDSQRHGARFRSSAAEAPPAEVDEVVVKALRRRTRAVVLSPTLWSAASLGLKRDPRCFALDFRIVESAWPALERVLGVAGVGLPA